MLKAEKLKTLKGNIKQFYHGVDHGSDTLSSWSDPIRPGLICINDNVAVSLLYYT